MKLGPYLYRAQYVQVDRCTLMIRSKGLEHMTDEMIRARQHAQRIAKLNDLARTAMGVFCRLVQTEGICALAAADQSRIREKVETFKDFENKNDPYGEHDFGAFDHAGQKVFWKIDYYNRAMDGGSDDPANPRVTVRVLTIMLAEEY